MRKKIQKRKFSRKRDQRRALLKGLLNELFLRERITTTEEKAKETKKFAEKLLSKAKKGDLHSRREIAKTLSSKKTVKKIVDELIKRYQDRNGGYVRIIKLGRRKSDGAKMSIIELIK